VSLVLNGVYVSARQALSAVHWYCLSGRPSVCLSACTSVSVSACRHDLTTCNQSSPRRPVGPTSHYRSTIQTYLLVTYCVASHAS